ncbi:MAG: ribosome-binding factor A [Candidatus Obscuribacter sp.]|nr:ribosome-binding factor A [Candidatus Obscuribacter sp.]
MSAERALRVSQAIKRELADMLRKDLRDERLKGLISITEVESTSDLEISQSLHLSLWRKRRRRRCSRMPQ